jgi:hypothetical protein
VLGTTTGTLGEPATACAKPKDEGVDWAAVTDCIFEVGGQFVRGEITEKELHEKTNDCCVSNGAWAEWNPETGWRCFDPEDELGDEGLRPPGQLPQVPDPTEATQVPLAPSGPVVPLPGLPPAQTRWGHFSSSNSSR